MSVIINNLKNVSRTRGVSIYAEGPHGSPFNSRLIFI